MVNRKVSIPSITDAEWEVMEVLWASPSARTASEVIESLADRRDRSPRTVKTLLARLVKKGAVGFLAEGNRYLYRAKVRREDCVRKESRSFLTRVFGGSAAEMLCRFVDDVELTSDELDRLRKLLDKKRGGK